MIRSALTSAGEPCSRRRRNDRPARRPDRQVHAGFRRPKASNRRSCWQPKAATAARAGVNVRGGSRLWLGRCHRQVASGAYDMAFADIEGIDPVQWRASRRQPPCCQRNCTHRLRRGTDGDLSLKAIEHRSAGRSRGQARGCAVGLGKPHHVPGIRPRQRP
jgi:hypothetical protein